MSKFILKLYITGQTPKSRAAIANLRRICAQKIGGEDYEIAIIDVLEQPQEAEEEQILATPTLVKEAPPPPRRIIGDLTEEAVKRVLDLHRIER